MGCARFGYRSIRPHWSSEIGVLKLKNGRIILFGCISLFSCFAFSSESLYTGVTSRDASVRKSAVEQLPNAFDKLEPADKKILIAKLLKGMDDVGTMEEGPGVSEYAQNALIALGHSAVPDLIQAFRKQNRRSVHNDFPARVLGRIRPPVKEVIPDLVSLLRDVYLSPPRGDWAFALGEIGVTSKEVLKALTDALAYRWPDIQGGIDLNSYIPIAIALKKLGQPPKAAQRTLEPFLYKVNVYEKIQAADGLLQLRMGTSQALETLGAVIGSREYEPAHYEYALKVLGNAGKIVDPLVPKIVKLTEARNMYLDKSVVVKALEGIGTKQALAAAEKVR